MTDSIPSPPPLPKREPPPAPRPGFVRAGQGVGHLMWKSLLTWRRLPGLLVTLLAIPLLTYFTLEPLRQLTGRYDWREDPRRLVNEFRASAASANVSLGRGLGTKLVQIVAEEQGRVQLPPRSTGPSRADRFSAEDLNWQMDQARQCRERILERARTVLDERQHQRLTEFLERKLTEALAQIQQFNLQDVRPFYRWLVDFYFLLALPLYCLSVCGSMMRDELQADTLGFLTTRPVTRAQLFLVKYLCQITWLQALAAVEALLLFAAGLARGAPGAASAMGLFFGAQFLAVLAWGALSALLGLATRRYILLGILYGFVVEIGLGRIPTNINTLSLTRHLQGLLGHNVLLNQLYAWAPQGGWVSMGALLLATVLFLGAGAALFTFREYHHVTEMQK